MTRSKYNVHSET